MKLQDSFKQTESVMFLRGNVKIIDKEGNVEVDKDNAITDYFRKLMMDKLFNGIHAVAPEIEGVIATGERPADADGYIHGIRFGSGSSSTLGAKASRKDTALLNPIPSTLSDNSSEPLYINTSVLEGLNVEFDYGEQSIKFSGDLINNDTMTYILGELGIFYSITNSLNPQESDMKMLSHLFFDPIFFEPDTSKKIIYTIYFY